MMIPNAMDQVGRRLQQKYGAAPIPRIEIIGEVLKLGNWSRASIIPSDFCYNRENEGSRPMKYRVFLRDDAEWQAGLYRYVGRDYSYLGPVVRKPR